VLILNLYNVTICLVAAVLCIVVNRHEPNRRLAFVLKIAMVAVAVVAILGHLMR
jgi:multisubunit Na+/H+ antiporter MnhB subunit